MAGDDLAGNFDGDKDEQTEGAGKTKIENGSILVAKLEHEVHDGSLANASPGSAESAANTSPIDVQSNANAEREANNRAVDETCSTYMTVYGQPDVTATSNSRSPRSVDIPLDRVVSPVLPLNGDFWIVHSAGAV
jgi:hypothetical protein